MRFELPVTMETLPDRLRSLSQAISNARLQLGESSFTLGSLVALVAVLVGSWLIARHLERAINRVLWRRGADYIASGYVVARLARYSVWVIGTLVGLQVLGLNLANFALIGGAVGLGIGFGLQNLVSNFVSGLVLLVERSIKLGDFVDLASGVRGTVTEIGVRYTRVTTNSAVDVIVPNSEFTSQRVINWTLDNRYRRLNIPFSVAYGSDKGLVREAALAAAESVPSTVSDAERRTNVWFTEFGDSALQFELVVWVGRDSVNRPGSTRSLYLWAIDDELRKRDIEVPFPQRDLHVRSGSLRVSVDAPVADESAARRPG